MSLVRAERRRLHKRRVTQAMLAVGLLLLTAIAIGTWFSNQKVDDATRAAAQVQAQRDYEQVNRDWNERYKAQCEDEVKAGRIPAEACVGPQPEDFRAEYYMPSTFDFKAASKEMLTVWAVLMGLVALIIGASSIGAEWSSGGMMNLLTWQPRRMKVLGTKLGVLLATVAAWAAAIGVLWVVALWLIGTYRGTTAGMTAGAWNSFALAGLRGIGVVAAAATFGFVLASLGRRTAVALGVLLAMFVVLQFGLTMILYMAQVKYPDLFFVGMHLSAWMTGEEVLHAQSGCDISSGACQPETLTLTWQKSGAIFASGLAALVGVAMWQIRRRDVV